MRILGAVFILVLGCEFLAFQTSKKYPAFVNLKPSVHNEEVELSMPLYGGLDPYLGYTHDPEYRASQTDNAKLMGLEIPDQENLKNGFVTLKYQVGQQTPLRIGILGNSCTDPFIYGGNWPVALHELLRVKNISHVIYNGAVSGYNSQQILVKLTRDLYSFGKMDLVIVYSAITDFPEFGDAVASYPAIHPYQKKMYDVLAGNQMSEPLILPNLQWYLRSNIDAFKPRVKPIVMGVKNEDSLENLKRSVIFMNAIVESQQGKFIHLNEAYLEKGTARAENNPFASNENPEEERYIREYLQQANERLKNLPFHISIQDQLGKKEKIFFDAIHFNKNGQNLLAAELLKKLPIKIENK